MSKLWLKLIKGVHELKVAMWKAAVCHDLEHTDNAGESSQFSVWPDLDAKENAREICCLVVCDGAVWVWRGWWHCLGSGFNTSENSASHFILFIFQPGSNLKIIPSSVPQPTGQADKSHEKIDFFHFPNNSTTPSTHNEDCCWTYVDTDLCLT